MFFMFMRPDDEGLERTHQLKNLMCPVLHVRSLNMVASIYAERASDVSDDGKQLRVYVYPSVRAGPVRMSTSFYWLERPRAAHL